MTHLFSHVKRILFAALVFCVPIVDARAASFDANEIQIIKDAAASICNSVKELKGDKTKIEIEGDVSAKLSGLVSKLADAGVSGKGSLSKEDFNGLTQDATAIAIEGDRQCRERLIDKMFDKLSMNAADSRVYAFFEVIRTPA
jgi:hypothetical protein